MLTTVVWGTPSPVLLCSHRCNRVAQLKRLLQERRREEEQRRQHRARRRSGTLIGLLGLGGGSSSGDEGPRTAAGRGGMAFADGLILDSQTGGGSGIRGGSGGGGGGGSTPGRGGTRLHKGDSARRVVTPGRSAKGHRSFIRQGGPSLVWEDGAVEGGPAAPQGRPQARPPAGPPAGPPGRRDFLLEGLAGGLAGAWGSALGGLVAPGASPVTAPPPPARAEGQSRGRAVAASSPRPRPASLPSLALPSRRGVSVSARFAGSGTAM